MFPASWQRFSYGFLRSPFIARTCVTALLVVGVFFDFTVSNVSAARTSARVRFKDIIEQASQLAATPYKDLSADLPEAFRTMGYDQWRGIRYRPDQALWGNESFSAQFFHPGFLYQYPVQVNYVDNTGTYPISFSSDLFRYDTPGLKELLPDGNDSFAGFRLHYPLNTPAYADELLSFLGASYFRALGRNLRYGLSARGLAINTGAENGEEFPVFREFWLVKPSAKAKQIIIYALLDSATLTGAYEFTVIPGEKTLMKVNMFLFFRRQSQKLGIAPLTSMFFYGEDSGFRGNSDFRPEVHDSDGLLLHASSGERIWHPLLNPQRLLINSFSGGTPQGFGLLQRDSHFDHYQDLEARYERRPSVWVTPQGDWGAGHLELVQIPTENEYNDNVVTYWVPEKVFERGDSVNYAYTLSWQTREVTATPTTGIVTATRVVRKDKELLFLIDFEKEGAKDNVWGNTLVEDVWCAQGAQITNSQIIMNDVTGGRRLVLRVLLDPPHFIEEVLPYQKTAVEFRAFLKRDGRPLTETWSYTYFP
jgi:glucans biosynthesis protein